MTAEYNDSSRRRRDQRSRGYGELDRYSRESSRYNNDANHPSRRPSRTQGFDDDEFAPREYSTRARSSRERGIRSEASQDRPYEQRRRPDSTRANGQPRSSYDRDEHMDSVYRSTRNRSRYDRSSNRYTSANAENRREGRREVRSSYAQPQRQNANATRYSRDHYLRRDGQNHAMNVSQQSYAAARRETPVNPKTIIALAAIALFLLAIIIVRFMVFGGTAAEYGQLRDEISAQQTQLEEFETASNEAQTQIDAWQETIDTYNKSKK